MRCGGCCQASACTSPGEEIFSLAAPPYALALGGLGAGCRGAVGRGVSTVGGGRWVDFHNDVTTTGSNGAHTTCGGFLGLGTHSHEVSLRRGGWALNLPWTWQWLEPSWRGCFGVFTSGAVFTVCTVDSACTTCGSRLSARVSWLLILFVELWLVWARRRLTAALMRWMPRAVQAARLAASGSTGTAWRGDAASVPSGVAGRSGRSNALTVPRGGWLSRGIWDYCRRRADLRGQLALGRAPFSALC